MHRLKTGSWITLERIRVYSVMMLAFWAVGILAVLVTSEGGLDFLGRPLGTDFSNVWSAGRLVLDSNAAAAYDTSLHHAVQKAAFNSPNIPYYGWHYPPFFLFIAGALALLPYGSAVLVWLSATFPLYLGVVHKISDVPLTLLLAAAYPAVAVNMIHGQNGFLSAALLGAGVLCLDRRPVLAGLAFGLLAYKPQFGLLIPLVLGVTGRWRVFGVASLTVAILIGASTAVFGFEIWQAFIDSTRFTRTVVLEGGALAPEKMLSIFAAFRMWGFSVTLAYIAQGVLALFVATTLVKLWQKPVAVPLKSAALVTATLLVTPYAMDYDLVILGLGLVWMVTYGLENGFLPWEKSALVLVWALPMLSRVSALALSVPLGLMGLLMFYGLILRRVEQGE
ncbi:MAG: DUF2029 domain-containing protein [Magnetovibrio sp.]|nr:DUF2029 domain-containing protein [Magnetovibrio sp.]